MGIVASLASAPLTVEIFKQEMRHEKERRDHVRYGVYQHGDADLNLIKKLTAEEKAADSHHHPQQLQLHHQSSAGQLPSQIRTPHHHQSSVDYQHLEKCYLTGKYKDKYKYLQQHNTNGNGNRKSRSAYPAVRFEATPTSTA